MMYFSLSIWLSFYFVPILVNRYSSLTIFIFFLFVKLISYYLYSYISYSFSLYLISALIAFSERTIAVICNYNIVVLFPNIKGMMTGCFVAGVGINVLFWSNIMTFVINPNNMKPGKHRIFPEEIVPNFLYFQNVLFLINMIMGLIAVFLLKDIDKFMKSKETTENKRKFNINSSLTIELIEKFDKTGDLVSDLENRNIDKSEESGEEIKKIVLSAKFIFIWLTCLLRATFYYFAMGNFKFIVLKFIEDDHYVNFVASVAFFPNIISRIVIGYTIDYIDIRKISYAVYIGSIIVIIIWLTVLKFNIFFVISMFMMRTLGGANSVLNNIMIYKYYPKRVALDLLKYFTTFFFLSNFVNNLLIRCFPTIDTYTPILIVFSLLLFTGLILLKNTNYKNY